MPLFSVDHSPAAYRADFVLYGTAVVALAVYVLAGAVLSNSIVPVALALAGLAVWSIFEYLLHRFLFHGPQPFRRLHALHHQHPAALICSPTWLTVSLFTLLVFAPARSLGTGLQAGAFTLGMLAGYFAYSVAHHAVHHWRGQGAWLLRRKRWHARHHRTEEGPVCYGVTTGVWDHVFGSDRLRSGT